MSRKPNMIAFRERTRLEDVLADIKEYAGDETLPNRDILLPQAAMQVSHFNKELVNSPATVTSLLATVRMLRESSEPGKCSAEKWLITGSTSSAGNASDA